MEVMIKRGIDPETFVQPMTFYAAAEGVDFSPENPKCRRVITINAGYEYCIELQEGESVIYAAVGYEPNVALVAELKVEKRAKMRKFLVECKDKLSNELKFEFIELDLKEEWLKKLDLGRTVAVAIISLLVLIVGFFAARQIYLNFR